MNHSNTYVAIMAGGIGSRFWPASRTSRPKQFLDILGVGKSLIRLTFERFLKICPADHIFIVTNEMYKDLVKEHLPEITDNQILCEPSRNNTGPCVAYTGFKLNSLNQDSNFIVAPSDHIILKEDAFVTYLEEALSYTANSNAIVTLGIKPTRPDTGYGYINYKNDSANGVKKVFTFKEKPDLDTAKSYISSGNYLWNAGIFVWSSKTIVEAFKELAPAIYEILSKGKALYNTENEQNFINKAYPTTPSISVDYAILEKSKNVYTIPVDIGWSDLGTWGSLHVESNKDQNKNVINGNKIDLTDVHNSLIRIPKDKLAVIKGLDDYIVVDEDDIILIWPKNQEQGIKAKLKELKERKKIN